MLFYDRLSIRNTNTLFPSFFFFFLLFLQLVEQQQRKTLIGFFRQKDALMNKSPKKLK